MLSSRSIHLDVNGRSHNLSTARTPGKMGGKGRGGLQENAINQGAMTVGGKGKRVALNTPGQPHSLQPQRLFKDPSHQNHLKTGSKAAARPLVDKTPFANRSGAPFVTPLPRGSKISKIALGESQTNLQTPGGLLRPSSTRKHARAPRSASKSFETPQTQGNHWDVSDVSIEGPEMAAVNESIEEEDFGEIEYMPPSAIDPPYEPMFDMPDYKTLGRAIATLVHSYPFDDAIPYDTEPEDPLLETDSHLALPEMDDEDPFRPLPPRLKASTPGITSRPVPRVVSNPSKGPQPAASAIVQRRQISTMSSATRSTATSRLGTRTTSSSRPDTAASARNNPAAQTTATTTRQKLSSAAMAARSRTTTANSTHIATAKSTAPKTQVRAVSSMSQKRPGTSTASSRTSVTLTKRPGSNLIGKISTGGKLSNEDIVLSFDAEAKTEEFVFNI